MTEQVSHDLIPLNSFLCLHLVTCSYKDTLCGLCGDYNDNAKDDMRKPDGTLTNDPNVFGHSWVTDPNVSKWVILTHL